MSGRHTLKLLATILLLFTTVHLTTAISITTFFEREPDDELIYLQTKITMPTADFEVHRLDFNWRGTNQRFTQIKVEMNGYNSASIYRSPSDNSFNAYVYDEETKQLIVTLFVYGFNETWKYNDGGIPFSFRLLDGMAVNNTNY